MSGWKQEIIWYFANSHRVMPAPSVGIPDGGVRGSGCSGTKGVFVQHDPDLDALARYGATSRALHKIGDDHRRVLELAYGDVGAAVTECSLRPGDRWKAVAPMTPTVVDHVPTRGRKQLAKLRGDKPLDERRRDTSCGPLAVHLCQHLLTRPKPTQDERDMVDSVRAEATAMLRAAEQAFEVALGQAKPRVSREEVACV